jgi:SPW repeat
MLTLKRDYAAQARIASGINILLGVWLIDSPWIFDYSGSAAVLNSIFVGVLIAVLAASRLASLRNTAGLSAVNLILAMWIIASPWVCGYSTNVGAVRDNLLLGIAIATFASWSGSATFFGLRHPPGAPVH